MPVRNASLKGVVRKLILAIDQHIHADETMAEAAALVARDFLDADQPRIADYLQEIGRQHRVSALHLQGQREALKLEYRHLL